MWRVLFGKSVQAQSLTRMVNPLLRGLLPSCVLDNTELGMLVWGHSRFTTGRGGALVMVVVTGLLLAGCQNRATAELDADPLSTASLSPAKPSFKRTEELGQKWKSDPTNVSVATAYATSLESLGQKPTQIEVLRATAEKTRGDAAAQGKLGRLLMAAGDPEGAEEILNRAVLLNPQDVQGLSALGAVLDQQTKHSEAREKYTAALAIAPNDMGVVNNLAMSYALQGKLPEAEATLRKAITHPNGRNMPRIRQNLALVVGLSGRFDEAKRIASEDLPPDQVQANMEFLQQMLARPNTWAQLQQNG
jgi:Flp pilus assembly protein TadD